MTAAIQYASAPLYPKQREAIFNPARTAVCEASVKSGKTSACLAWIFEKAFTEGNPGRNYWWCAPVYHQASIGFRRSRRNLHTIRHLCKFNQSALTITVPSGATVWFKSAERASDLYGEDVYAAVLDEAAWMREDAYEAIRTTLTYTKGPLRIIGNVIGRKTWFYQLARQAEAGAPDMSYHKLTCYDAIEGGVLDPVEIEASREEFASRGREGAWKQLYLAEASDDGENPFGLEAIRACVKPLSDKLPAVAGVDLAGRGAVNVREVRSRDVLERDYTAIVLLDREGVATHVERFRLPHTETEQRIVEVVGRVPALIDSTGAGDAIVERLQRRGDMRVEGYPFSARSRQDLLEHLALMIGEQAVGFPDGQIRSELESFELAYSSQGARWTTPGSHGSDRSKDDLAFALALAAKKLPWRRRMTQVPVGLPSPEGSRWLGTATGESGEARRRYEESLDPTTRGLADEAAPADGGPLMIMPTRGSIWEGADR
jgi:hypothetical protein